MSGPHPGDQAMAFASGPGPGRDAPRITLRETDEADVTVIMDVVTQAFGGDSEARLVEALLRDASARPALSLLALEGNKPVGHILFTRASFRGQASSPLMHILAPLAVRPACQGKGVGGLLIRTGTELLRQQGSTLVLVLGHRDYYPRHGFTPHAARSGVLPPFPIPPEHADCWMFQALGPAGEGPGHGTLKCADALDKPHLWQAD